MILISAEEEPLQCRVVAEGIQMQNRDVVAVEVQHLQLGHAVERAVDDVRDALIQQRQKSAILHAGARCRQGGRVAIQPEGAPAAGCELRRRTQCAQHQRGGDNE